MNISLKESITKKRTLIEEIRLTLKAEFFGIDDIVDELLNTMGSWYLFPGFQDRPLIINLWGLTGVGKTSLVQRIADLLGFGKKCFRFDLGDPSHNEHSMRRNIMEISANYGDAPAIFIFDEFQHSRTIDETGAEAANLGSRIVWEILDRGAFQTSFFSEKLSELSYWATRLTCLLEKGVLVSNGKVIEGKDIFVREVSSIHDLFIDEELKAKKSQFVVSDLLRIILSVRSDEFPSLGDLRARLDTMDGYRTIQFLNQTMEIASQPQKVDCSKSLVFIIGNLDEAYAMATNTSPDVDADILCSESKRITVGHIKQALGKRFRAEQIARLGNIHILYPSLSRNAFERIIIHELLRVARRFEDTLSVKLVFDPSVNDMIYKEGVFPTQGTRPLLTTIGQHIQSNMGRIAEELSKRSGPIDSIVLFYSSESLVAKYFVGEDNLHTVDIPLQLRVHNMRKTRNDELQTVVAVHESGHAIVGIALLDRIPISIYSVSADPEMEGFVHFEKDEEFINRSEFIKWIAKCLGGLAAEELIFGKEYITDGASHDIKQATNMVANHIRSCGFGREKLHIRPEVERNAHSYHDRSGESNDEIKEFIREGYDLALATLRNEEQLLVRLSDYLSRNPSIQKADLLTLLSKYSKRKAQSEQMAIGMSQYYRTTLKSKYRQTDSTFNSEPRLDLQQDMENV